MTVRSFLTVAAISFCVPIVFCLLSDIETIGAGLLFGVFGIVLSVLWRSSKVLISLVFSMFIVSCHCISFGLEASPVIHYIEKLSVVTFGGMVLAHAIDSFLSRGAKALHAVDEARN